MQMNVSFVLPVYNGGCYLEEVLEAIFAQDFHSQMEVVVVDDGSTDGSWSLLQRYQEAGKITLLKGHACGAASALNLGIGAATHPLICQLDQDMIPEGDWLASLLRCVAEQPKEGPELAAVQGYFLTDPADGVWARVSGIDLEQRYQALRPSDVDHVCTGNTLYLSRALSEVGLFDESLGYGYDNDMSYRLSAAGYRLAHCPAALATHRRKPGLWAYLQVQYGVGYGRLDLVGKHLARARGDQVSPVGMILHAAGMLTALCLALFAAALAAHGTSWKICAGGAAALLGLMALDRLIAGLRATATHAWIGLLLPPAHLLRDLAWSLAIVWWSIRRGLRRTGRAEHSMRRSRR